MKRGSFSVGALCLLAASACSDAGHVAIALDGQGFVEEGVGIDGFIDGWGISFDAYVVSLKDVVVAGRPIVDPAPVDLAIASDGAGHVFDTVEVDAGEYRDLAFTIDRIEIIGHADNHQTTKSFQWLIEDPIRYDACDAVTEVAGGETTKVPLVLHAERMFATQVDAADPLLIFQPFADADTNGNGEIEVDGELWEAGLGGLDADAFETQNLWVWMIFAARNIVSVGQSGACRATPVN